MATSSLSAGLLFILLTMGLSNAANIPTGECAYLTHYILSSDTSLLPSLVPSVSRKCVEAYNNITTSWICIAECQSLYSLLVQCGAPLQAASFSSYCGPVSLNDSDLVSAVKSACSNATYCSPTCVVAIAALEQNSGCNQNMELNGPKVLCGQQPIAPCSTILNNGSVVAAPSSECAYFNYYLDVHVASFTPSLNEACRAAVLNAADREVHVICIVPECRSLYDLLVTCDGTVYADQASLHCGRFNNQNCSSLFLNDTELRTDVRLSCANSTYCTPSCLAAVAALEQYGGCCYADVLNGPKVLCGQQPISYCPTIFNSAVPSPISGTAA